MVRLCGRPGCSEPAAVAYGMVPADLVFWLAELPLDPDPDGMLCTRHADAMVVPRGWTLDDRRDPDLHLFRPPAPASAGRAPRRRRPAVEDPGEQLDLGLDERADDGPEDARVEASVPTGPDEPPPWSPRFDEHDDLGGLLHARGPLLARAFRTAGRDDR